MFEFFFQLVFISRFLFGVFVEHCFNATINGSNWLSVVPIILCVVSFY